MVKNKVAPPFKDTEFDILYGSGISHEGELVDLGAECGILEKSGAWYAFDNERIGQGRENTKDFLREHPEIAQAIERKIRARFGIPGADGAAATGEAQAGSPSRPRGSAEDDGKEGGQERRRRAAPARLLAPETRSRLSLKACVVKTALDKKCESWDSDRGLVCRAVPLSIERASAGTNHAVRR